MKVLVGRCPNCRKITALASVKLSSSKELAEFAMEWRHDGLIVAEEEMEKPSLYNSCNTRDCRIQQGNLDFQKVSA